MKKINYEQCATLLNYSKKHPFERIACNHYIAENSACVRVITKIKLPVYILLFVPIHLLQAIALIWDGGLKEFSIESRTSNHLVWKDSKGYKKFSERG